MRPPRRLHTLDAVRGVAVMGIILPNIVVFALPSAAAADPRVWGEDAQANLWTWAAMFVLAEGKMRGLFSLLFGASLLLVVERAAAAGRSPATPHFARMAVLGAIGMAHAYLVWSGDILVTYALCGAIAFAAWRLPVAGLLALSALLMAMQVATGVVMHHSARAFEARALTPGAPPELQREWARFEAAVRPSPAEVSAEVATYRGGWASVSPARFAAAREHQAVVLPFAMIETLAMMFLGMALLRSGFLSGAWPRRTYRRIVIVGAGVTVPLYALLAWWMARGGFDPITRTLVDPLHLALLRPPLTLAYAAAAILLVRAASAPGLARRLAATGRMAFSNYLLTSIVCTLLFYGYGLGWFGRVERWQLYGIVPLLWLAMLAWSPAWLARFAYGPFEWLWRSASRGRMQPLRR